MNKPKIVQKEGFIFTENSIGYEISCIRCDAKLINGHPCHELGCPNDTNNRHPFAMPYLNEELEEGEQS